MISNDNLTESLTHFLMRQEFFAEAKVCQHNVTFIVKQNILQLDIAVDNAQLRRNK
jgi:hypothetical protein